MEFRCGWPPVWTARLPSTARRHQLQTLMVERVISQRLWRSKLRFSCRVISQCKLVGNECFWASLHHCITQFAHCVKLQPSRQDVMLAGNISADHVYIQGWHLHQMCLIMFTFHIRRWRGWWWCYYKPTRLLTATVWVTPLDISKDTWGTFPELFHSDQKWLFLRASRPISIHGHRDQNGYFKPKPRCFPNPDHVFFLHKSKQIISILRFSFIHLSVGLQKHTYNIQHLFCWFCCALPIGQSITTHPLRFLLYATAWTCYCSRWTNFSGSESSLVKMPWTGLLLSVNETSSMLVKKGHEGICWISNSATTCWGDVSLLSTQGGQ